MSASNSQISFLEVNAGGELANAGIVCLILGHNTIGIAPRGRAGTAEVGSVENVEEFAANFERDALVDLEFLEERGVGKRMHNRPDGLHAYAESVKSEAGSLFEGRY